jgi:alpha-1,3-rhamnosyl/mannosyltransferase
LSLGFRAACCRGRFDLYHEPNFMPLAGGVPTVITVHDLSVLLHPEWHPSDRVRLYERQFRQGLAAACHVIADTRAVREEVIANLGVPGHRVTAVHLGVGPEYLTADASAADEARRALGLPEEYLLFVGTIEPRKNVATLVRAYRDLPATLRARCPLILAGGWGWKANAVAELVRADHGVVHLGYTPEQYIPGLYAAARALVYPSLYEGFGLPPLEMLATGGAVLASTDPALQEVVGRHGHFTPPLDVAGWRDALARAITDDDWLAEVRQGGRLHAASLTWERCAAATASVYKAVCDAPARAA